VIAGWWAWAVCVQIGAFDGKQGWTADPVTGQIYLQPRGKTREPGVKRNLPHLSDDGQGVNHSQLREPGVSRGKPHLADNGKGVNCPQLREPGVKRDRPHLTSNGQGVNHPQLREPGVSRGKPHLNSDGQGVNCPQLREPGVRRDRPHLTNNGQGVNQPQLREPGVWRDLPHLANNGQGVNRPQLREPGVLDPITPAHGVSALDVLDWGAEFLDLTMPEIIRWFRYLSARLRHVRVVNGDWQRVCTAGALKTLEVRMKHGVIGVFLDPPYGTDARRAPALYAVDSLTVADAVRDWCLANGDDPDLRIVLAGFDGEHGAVLQAAGWREHEWYKSGFLRGGMGNTNHNGTHQQHRERLWSSPHCLHDGAPVPVNGAEDAAQEEYLPLLQEADDAA
jgi:hypothetical protein